jgi:ATP-dependent Zn protease
MEYRFAGEFSDFRKANDIARDLIEDYGLVPPQSSNNLQYSFCNLRGKETATYIDRINTHVEQLLDYEYENVNKILKQHQSFLHNMIQTVLLKKELFQDEILNMWLNYSEKPVPNTRDKLML